MRPLSLLFENRAAKVQYVWELAKSWGKEFSEKIKNTFHPDIYNLNWLKMVPEWKAEITRQDKLW
jgi:hypothetical protein